MTFADKLIFKILISKIDDFAKEIGFTRVEEYREDRCMIYRKGNLILDVVLFEYPGTCVRVYNNGDDLISKDRIYEVNELDLNKIYEWVKETIEDVRLS